jgi:membrane fusion protein (multidrug efflux system)
MKNIPHSFIFHFTLTAAVLLTLSGCNVTPKADARPTADATVNASVPVIQTVRVASHPLDATVSLPGELQPFEVVAIYPKVSGFVQWIGVDRGSKVHRGQLLARLVAPELTSQRAEEEAKLQSAESRQIEAEAKATADQATYQRLKVAANTPGVISDDELQIAQANAAADQARATALRQTVEAARATLKAVEDIASYLQIVAPFDGVVTDRNVHPGALVGPAAGGGQLPMLNISQVAHLRLVVAVPETEVADIAPGAVVSFAVASYPAEIFHGKVARLADSVDMKTRTMPVEMDVENSSGRLSPGMYPQVIWPVRHAQESLFVPASAIVHSMEETFVIEIKNGETAWIPVQLGAASGDEMEIFGSLSAGTEVAQRGTEELRPNRRVSSAPATDEDISKRL